MADLSIFDCIKHLTVPGQYTLYPTQARDFRDVNKAFFIQMSAKTVYFTPQINAMKAQSKISWCDVWHVYVQQFTVVNSLECYLGRTHSGSTFHSPCSKHLESGTQPKCYRLIWWNRALDLWLRAACLCQALFVFPLCLIPQLHGFRNVSFQNDDWWHKKKKKRNHSHIECQK